MATARSFAPRNPYDVLMPAQPSATARTALTANDPGAVDFGNYDPALNQTATPEQAPVTPIVNNPAGARPQTGLYDPLAPAVSGDRYAIKPGESAQAYAARLQASGVSVTSQPLPNETAEQFRARNQSSSLQAAYNNPANKTNAFYDTAAILGGVGSVLMNPIGAAIDPYTPDAVSFAVNPVGETMRQGTRAITNAAVPGNPLGTNYGVPGAIAAGPTPQTQNYQPRTGIGAPGGGAGVGGDAGAAMQTLSGIAANPQAAQVASLPGYQAPQQFNGGAGYVPYQDSGGGAGYVPYTDQNRGAGYVPYQDNAAGASGYVPYQDVGGGQGYVPFQDTGPYVEDLTENRIGYTGGKFGYTGGRQEDPLLGYIQYTEEDGPSKAEALLTTALERAQANALGQAAMAQGGPGAVARARRQAQFSNAAMSSRAGAELAAMRADEEERKKQRLLQGEIAARGRQVEELTAQRGRQSTEEIAARGRELSEEEAAQQRFLDENMSIRGQQVEQAIAAGNRRMTGEISARDRASQEEISRAQRILTGEVSARDRASAESVAAANRMLQGEMNARQLASSESIAEANRNLTGEVSARDRASSEAVAAANRQLQGEIAARGNASAEAIANANRASQAEIAARNNASNEAIANQRNQLDAQNSALQRQLDAAVASGNIANQQLIQDKINQNAIDRLYLQDQLGTPTTEERLYGGASQLLPIIGQAIL